MVRPHHCHVFHPRPQTGFGPFVRAGNDSTFRLAAVAVALGAMGVGDWSEEPARFVRRARRRRTTGLLVDGGPLIFQPGAHQSGGTPLFGVLQGI